MDHIEKILERAREHGDFDNLPGAGKPLDLRENPFVPAEWQLAYRMLASSGFAPDVVEADKALRTRIAEMEQRLDAFARRWTGWQHMAATESQRDRQHVLRQEFLAEYEADLQEINNRIHSFNAQAPVAMQRGTFRVPAMVNAARTRLGA